MNERLALFGGKGAISPFHGPQTDIAVLIGNSTIGVDARILRTYLPKLLHSRALAYDGTIDLNQLVWRSSNVGSGRVSRHFMKQTLHKIINSLAQEVGRSNGATLKLMTLLERTVRRHQEPHRGHIYGETYQYFASLSEISKFCGSERIASVLEQFFSKYGGQVAEQEGSFALFEWARAIVESSMKDAAMCVCLREILLVRPNFDEEIANVARRSGSQQAMVLFQGVSDVLARMSTSDFVPMERGRGMIRRGAVMHRRYTSPYRYRPRPRRPMFLGRPYSSSMIPTRGALAGVDKKVLVRPGETRRLNQVKQQMDHIQHRQRFMEEVLEHVAERADVALQASSRYLDDDEFELGSNWGEEIGAFH
jgi:hypothetical protein